MGGPPRLPPEGLEDLVLESGRAVAAVGEEAQTARRLKERERREGCENEGRHRLALEHASDAAERTEDRALVLLAAEGQ
jgi:hypothetical protein